MIDGTKVAIKEQAKEVVITCIDVDKMWEHVSVSCSSCPGRDIWAVALHFLQGGSLFFVEVLQ